MSGKIPKTENVQKLSGSKKFFGFLTVVGVFVVFPFYVVNMLDPVFWAEGYNYYLAPLLPWYTLFCIGAFDPRRFAWALKIAAGGLVVLLGIYVVSEIMPTFRGEKPFWGGPGSDTLGSAIGLFFVAGVPSLIYIFRKR